MRKEAFYLHISCRKGNIGHIFCDRPRFTTITMRYVFFTKEYSEYHEYNICKKLKKKITEPIFHTTTTSGLFNLPSLCATKVGDEHLCRSIKRRQYMLPQTLTKLYILARIIIEICGIIIIITHLLIFQYIPCFVTTDFIVNHCTKLWSDSTLLIFENITFMETVFERL